VFGFLEGLRLSRSLSYSFIMPFYVLLTHLFYGASFIKGVFSKEVLR